MELRSLAHIRNDPDPAAMIVNDALHNAQSSPGPFIFLGHIQALEDLKDLLMMFRRYPKKAHSWTLPTD